MKHQLLLENGAEAVLLWDLTIWKDELIVGTDSADMLKVDKDGVLHVNGKEGWQRTHWKINGADFERMPDEIDTTWSDTFIKEWNWSDPLEEETDEEESCSDWINDRENGRTQEEEDCFNLLKKSLLADIEDLERQIALNKQSIKDMEDYHNGTK